MRKKTEQQQQRGVTVVHSAQLLHNSHAGIVHKERWEAFFEERVNLCPLGRQRSVIWDQRLLLIRIHVTCTGSCNYRKKSQWKHRWDLSLCKARWAAESAEAKGSAPSAFLSTDPCCAGSLRAGAHRHSSVVAGIDEKFARVPRLLTVGNRRSLLWPSSPKKVKAACQKR